MGGGNTWDMSGIGKYLGWSAIMALISNKKEAIL